MIPHVPGLLDHGQYWTGKRKSISKELGKGLEVPIEALKLEVVEIRHGHILKVSADKDNLGRLQQLLWCQRQRKMSFDASGPLIVHGILQGMFLEGLEVCNGFGSLDSRVGRSSGRHDGSQLDERDPEELLRGGVFHVVEEQPDDLLHPGGAALGRGHDPDVSRVDRHAEAFDPTAGGAHRRWWANSASRSSPARSVRSRRTVVPVAQSPARMGVKSACAG